MSAPKILLIDDEPEIARAMGFRLRGAGFAVQTASQGAEALEALGNGSFDAVLSDFMMPELNGLELTRIVKGHESWRSLPVILFSANANPEFRRRALDLGAFDYVSKMNGFGAIIETVRKALAPSAPQQSSSQATSLTRTLLDMLHIASSAESLPQQTVFALGSAERLAREILQCVNPGVSASSDNHAQ